MLSTLATALRAALVSAETATADFPALLDRAHRAARAVVVATGSLSPQHRLAGRVGGMLLSIHSLELARHRPVIVSRLRHLLGDVVEAEDAADCAMPPMPVAPAATVLAFRPLGGRYLWPESAR